MITLTQIANTVILNIAVLVLSYCAVKFRLQKILLRLLKSWLLFNSFMTEAVII